MQVQLPFAQRFGLIILILFALSWYGYARVHKPAPAVVNGTYRNVCCGAVTLRDGAIIGESARVPLTLESMKFGLTAYLPRRVVVRGKRVVMLGAEADGSISFSSDGRSFTLCDTSDCGHKFK